jgi:myo-inositol-1(or 4)-monophosphatase
MDLAMLAAGQLDVFWEFNLAPWDVAAGVLLVEEAGGRCTAHDGSVLDLHHPSPLGSNARLHDEMIDLLATVT